MPSIIIKRGREHKIKTGHPWLIKPDVEKTRGKFEDGQVVDFKDHRGRFLGRGYVNSQSFIYGRLLTRHRHPDIKGLIRQRIEEAVSFRQQWFPDVPALRLINSEGDFLPGLVVDQYGPYLVIQCMTLGIEQLKPIILETLIETEELP